MGRPIQIDPDEVDRIAGEFLKARQASDEQVRSLDGEIQKLRDQWKGATQEKFYSQYGEWKAAMDKFSPTLEQINGELKSAAQRFRAADTGQG